MNAYEGQTTSAGLDAAWLRDALSNLRLEDLDQAQLAVLKAAGAKINRAAAELAGARSLIEREVASGSSPTGPSETKEA